MSGPGAAPKSSVVGWSASDVGDADVIASEGSFGTGGTISICLWDACARKGLA